jgi:uncharacterized cofD-like protein
MALVPLDIAAVVSGADPERPEEQSEVRGQYAVATATGRVEQVALEPPDPPACPDAVKAVVDADWVVLGPGSWFTSVIPHLLVPELRQALETTTARKIVVLNLAGQPGETEGFAPETHLEVLADHAPGLTVDVVLADPACVPDEPLLRRTAERLGARLELADVSRGDGTPRHDPAKLAGSFSRIVVGP